MVYYHVSYTIYEQEDVSKAIGKGGELFEVDNPMCNINSGIELIENMKLLISNKAEVYKGKYIHIDSISRL